MITLSLIILITISTITFALNNQQQKFHRLQNPKVHSFIDFINFILIIISQRKPKMSKKMDKQNQSRLYYVSNQNMSDIKESIDEYSMNFDKQSVHKNSQSQIAQLISGSHPMSQSRGGLKSKTFLKPAQPIKQQINHQNEPVQQIKSSRAQQPPVNLGDHVFNIIKERYYQTNKAATDDPDVLYDFFLSQKKILSSMKPIKDEDIERQMPSMQRKLLVRKNFQKILTYYPHDVYYSLHLEAEKQKIDRQQQYKLTLLNKQMERQKQRDQNKKISKQRINQIVQNLHAGGAKKKEQLDKSKSPARSTKRSRARSTSDSPNRKRMTKQEEQKHKRTQFGRCLSEHFQNTMRTKGHPADVETVEKLYKFWDQQDRKSQYRIEWDEDTAKIAIEQYMYEQMEDLMMYAHKKLGFKCEKAVSLFKIYQQRYEQLNRTGRICIPMNSFEEYVKVYNDVQERKQLQHLKEQEQKKKNQSQKRKMSETKKFGRPVSATPISILAKPKQHGPPIQQLAQKYPHDKLIKTLMNQQNLKKARFSWQYGVHDLVKEVKINQWIKIDPKNSKQNFEQNIVNQLIGTFTGSNNNNSVMGTSSMGGSYFGNLKQKDQLMNLFAQENVYKDENWKQYGPLIQEAMLVKSYQNPWFRQCIIKYLQKLSRENNRIEADQVIFKKLFTYFDVLTQEQRSNQLSKLERFIELSENIAEKTEAQKKLQKDPSKEQGKQRRLFNDMLQKKAIEFVKERVQGKPIIMRNYLKQLFEEGMKEYPEYVKKTFNVVQGEKECPKLLRYEFYRMAKQINKITFERVEIRKNPVWVPTKRMPEDFNYKTFNNFAESYKKDKNAMTAKPQKKRFGASLWGRKKNKDRQNLFMTYTDAKQCIFEPKCSKNVM